MIRRGNISPLLNSPFHENRVQKWLIYFSPRQKNVLYFTLETPFLSHGRVRNRHRFDIPSRLTFRISCSTRLHIGSIDYKNEAKRRADWFYSLSAATSVLSVCELSPRHYCFKGVFKKDTRYVDCERKSLIRYLPSVSLKNT